MKKKTAPENVTYCSTFESPVGTLLLAADAHALSGLYFKGQTHFPAASRQWTPNPRHPILQKAARQLKEYFAGERTRFSLPLRAASPDFQKKVWRQIALVPFG